MIEISVFIEAERSFIGSAPGRSSVEIRTMFIIGTSEKKIAHSGHVDNRK